MFSEFIKSARSFLKNRRKDPLWALGAALVGMSVLYILRFYSYLPDDLARVERTQIKADTILKQKDEWLVLAKDTDNCTDLLFKTFNHSYKTISTLNSGQTIPKDEALVGLLLVEIAKNKLTVVARFAARPSTRLSQQLSRAWMRSSVFLRSTCLR